MSRAYGDPVEVWTADGRPARFAWQGRLFTVLRLLEHWVTTREWSGEPAEREFWRVEAMSDAEISVYELRHDLATDTWMLARAWD